MDQLENNLAREIRIIEEEYENGDITLAEMNMQIKELMREARAEALEIERQNK